MANEIVEATLAQMTSMGKKLRGLIRELSADVKTLKETGGQANVLERVKVNGRLLTPDSNKTVDVTVPTKVGQLENDASYQENKIETIQVNGTTQSIIGKTVNVHVPTAVGELTNDAGYQTNVLEGVKVNGLALEIDKSKNVDISIPTKVSELTNDKVYQTKTEVENAVKTAVAESKHLTFQKVSSVPAVEDASEDVMYLVMNPVTKHYDIYAKLVDESGNVIMDQLDDTTVDLSGYVEKEAGKGLSHNDFTDALLAKLNGIAEKANLYVHPSHTAYAEGLYKMTVNVLGHVTKATSVTKGDITALGIPGQDTHDWAGITDKPATFPPSAHNHDERYYTETETDKLLGGKSDTGHVHDDRYYTETEMDAKLSKKSDTGHTHDDRYYTESELDTKLAGKSATGHKHLWADITNKPSTFAPSAHKHVKADITDFPTSMPASDVSAWAKAATKPSYAWSEITGKPSTFTPVSHTHDDRYYTESEMNSKLGAKAESVVLAANSDLNTVKTPGIYSCGGGNSIKNKPSGLDAIGLIVVHNASGEYYTQILTSSSDANTYRRTCLNNTWSTWTQDKYTDTNTWRGIQNNLTSDSTSDSLSAAQGKALKTLVDGKAANGHTHTKSQVGLGNVDNTADANKSVKYATSAGSANTAAKATTADTANVLSGFKPRSGQEWGVQTGTFVHGECDSTGGDFAFRRDCPAAGQVSMVIDGCFYQHEGQYRVLDESDKNQFATAGHTHDDRYYTESEMDAKLAKKADTHSHPYLPTAGGNMGGTAMIAWPDSGNFNNKNDGVTFPVKRGGLSWSGQSDGIQLFAEETGSDNLELILQFADDNSNGLTIRNKSGAAVSRLDANGGFSGSVAWEKITGKPSTFTPATHSHAWGDVTGKPSTFAPSAHKHVKADITDFPTSLPASDVKAWAKAANKPNYSWEEITNKPSTFTPAGHKHVKADITDFPTLGTAAAKNVGDFAAASHSHSWDSVTGKPTTFAPSSHNHDDRYYTESEIDTKLSGKANSSHTHNYAGSSSAGGTAASVNGFTFGVQTSDPGANSSLTTNKFLFVYE
mgnify:CR=1 FL=1